MFGDGEGNCGEVCHGDCNVHRAEGGGVNTEGVGCILLLLTGTFGTHFREVRLLLSFIIITTAIIIFFCSVFFSSNRSCIVQKQRPSVIVFFTHNVPLDEFE